MPNPRFTATNINRAFQLNWHLSLFPREPVATEFPQLVPLLDQLRQATEKDGVRILRTKTNSKNAQLFFLSTTPEVVPSEIVRSVKGRLQYLIRETIPKAFQHHQMADPVVQKRFEEVGRFENADIDLAAEESNAYGRFRIAYHFVFTRPQRWSAIDSQSIRAWKSVAVQSVEKHGGRVAECSVLADHMHVLVKAPMSQGPESYALSIMNNLAFVEGRECVQAGYHVGTIGVYGRAAVK